MHYITFPFRTLFFHDGQWFLDGVALSPKAVSVIVGAVEWWVVEILTGPPPSRLPVLLELAPTGFMVPGDPDSLRGSAVEAVKAHCVGATGVAPPQIFDPAKNPMV